MLFLVVLTHNVQAEKQKQEQAIPDHVKADLALVQSLDDFELSQFGRFLAVGGDADPNWCDYSSLQSAIDAAAQQGITNIRVAYNKTYVENLVIDDISISLVGGYASCQAAIAPFSSPGSNLANIDGDLKSSVIVISGASQKNTILLKNLRLFNGVGTKLSESSDWRYGGGIWAHEADAKVSLNNVDVRNNSVSGSGGGIYIWRGDTDMLLLNSRVFLNTAAWGGGIYCYGTNSSIVLAQNSGINLNIASESGGGIVVNKCYFGLWSGTTKGGYVGISSNRANKKGGGIYAVDAPVLLNGQQSCNDGGSCLGDNTNPVSVNWNTSGLAVTYPHEGRGGGIYAENSTVTINAGYFEGNSGPLGGGISLQKSDMTVKRSGEACWDNQRCNMFLGNSTDGSGGAIYQLGGNVDISASFFEENLAVRGAAIFASGQNQGVGPSSTRIEGSVFNHNGSDTTVSIFLVGTISDLEIVHSTIADNTLSTEIPVAAILNMNSTIGYDPTLGIYSSILDNPGYENLYHDHSNFEASVGCIITNDPVSLSSANGINNPVEGQAGGARILKTIAGFVDRNNRNYKLAADSAAIDYCNTPSYVDVNFKDIDFQIRGVDDPNHPDSHFLSFFDIGADEAYFTPLILKIVLNKPAIVFA